MDGWMWSTNLSHLTFWLLFLKVDNQIISSTLLILSFHGGFSSYPSHHTLNLYISPTVSLLIFCFITTALFRLPCVFLIHILKSPTHVQTTVQMWQRNNNKKKSYLSRKCPSAPSAQTAFGITWKSLSIMWLNESLGHL